MVLKMFDFFRRHAFIRWASLIGVTMMMLASVMRLSYKEDILDFLPLDETDRQRMAIYEDISGMNRLFVIFENVGGAEETIEMVERFAEVVEETDTAGLCQSMRTSFDSESISEAIDFIVAKAPLLLTAADYKRMDSLLSKPGYIEAKLEEDLNTLMFPSGGWAEQHIGRDPLFWKSSGRQKAARASRCTTATSSLPTCSKLSSCSRPPSAAARQQETPVWSICSSRA